MSVDPEQESVLAAQIEDDFDDERAWVDDPAPVRRGRQTLGAQISLRLDADLAEVLRSRADERGVGYTTLARQLLEDAIRGSGAASGTRWKVADVTAIADERFATHMHHLGQAMERMAEHELSAVLTSLADEIREATRPTTVAEAELVPVMAFALPEQTSGRSSARRSTNKKSTAGKSTAKKSTARKTPAKKTTAKKATAKKATARKTTAKKTTSKKSGVRGKRRG